jgi:hypothetical protein
MTLTELANLHKTDKGRNSDGSGHGFADVYDAHLSKYRNSYTNILEIGIWNGESLRMWSDYFPNAQILGLDIEDKSQYRADRIQCDIIDQSNCESLDAFVTKTNSMQYDLIVDDGSHHMRDQQITLAYLFPLLKSGGMYILEDLHTSVCANGTILYNRPIEILSDRSNTTLTYLEGGPHTSIYLDSNQNKYLQTWIDSVKIFRIPNNNGVWGQHSITSIIIKK